MRATASVKFTDDHGKTVLHGARELLKVKELDTVVITGQAKRDKANNLTVIASQLYVKPSH